VTAALNGGASLDPILATTLVNVAASHGDSALFDRLAAAARKAGSPEEHYRYLYALTNFEDPALIQRALEYTLSPELRSQDTSLYLSTFFGNSATRDRAWTFTKQRWTELEAKVSISLGDVSLVSSLANFCSAEARDDIAGFFKGHQLPAAGRTLQQTIERINNCIDTRQRQQESLAKWLSAR
jgi:aminopeptidase N/puromycin-sensitive aminopeptidase